MDSQSLQRTISAIGKDYSVHGTDLLKIAQVCEIFDGEIVSVNYAADPVKTQKRIEDDVNSSIKYAFLVCECGNKDFHIVKSGKRYEILCTSCSRFHGSPDLLVIKRLLRINPHYTMIDKKEVDIQTSLELGEDEIFRTRKGVAYD